MQNKQNASSDNRTITKVKTNLHPRNKHRQRYDFQQLTQLCPELAQFVSIGKSQQASIDFSNPEAVKVLNRAILKSFYGITAWDIPANYLCPPIPGRADYIHYIADLLGASNHGVIPLGQSVHVLDIGVGANCVYPIIGHSEYDWSFHGVDIDPIALTSANEIIHSNHSLTGAITLQQQTNPVHIFNGILKSNERFDISICNPPFHSSLAEAQKGTQRKLNNLNAELNALHKTTKQVVQNFGGQSNELWCKGGETAFVGRMIKESSQFPDQCLWFTTLVSQESNLPGIYQHLKQTKVVENKTINMAQGQKKSRIVAWTFHSNDQRQAWFKNRINLK